MSVVLEVISDTEAEESKPAIPCHFAQLPPILQRIYTRRQVQSMTELDYRLSALLPYNTLKDIDKASERLSLALALKQQILIIGDFDTDGATSTALAVLALRQFGADRVSFLIPNRFNFGYGLTPEIVAIAALQKPDLIITVDNGISSVAGVAAANQAGIDVIITDHHLSNEELPKACAIINPNQANDQFASKHIAGVGVIFYVMLALRAHLEQKNWFHLQRLPKPNLAQFLDLVALGTVADVVKLDQNNRILVHQGLLRIKAGYTRPGILALLQVAQRPAYKIQAQDLGFSIGPRLNAAGRLDDMSLGVNCLLSQDMTTAFNFAQQLDHLNQERRALEKQMQQEAFNIIEHLEIANQLPVGLCLFDETWHQGIIGLVAGRIKEKLQRPVIAFANAEEIGMLKGSARSIPGVHIRDLLALINSRHPHLISKFGGHAMAAGLSILKRHFAEFMTVFNATIMEYCDENVLQPNTEHDGYLDSTELTLEIAELIQNSGPWGQGFPEPIFRGRFNVLSQRIVGERHLKMTLETVNTASADTDPKTNPIHNVSIAAIAFEINNLAGSKEARKQLDCLYRLSINEYQNKKSLQLIVEQIID